MGARCAARRPGYEVSLQYLRLREDLEDGIEFWAGREAVCLKPA